MEGQALGSLLTLELASANRCFEEANISTANQEGDTLTTEKKKKSPSSKGTAVK